MATSLLPSTLDAATLPVMIASLERLVYPKPTNGSRPGWQCYWRSAACACSLSCSSGERGGNSLTALCPSRRSMILALLYLLLHYRSTAERPRSRCLWFVRLVDRPSGRFIVVKCVDSSSSLPSLGSPLHAAVLAWHGWGPSSSMAASSSSSSAPSGGCTSSGTASACGSAFARSPRSSCSRVVG